MIAVDTNVLIYRVDSHDLVKQTKARQLMRNLVGGTGQTVLLWQVAGEFVRFLRAWEDKGLITRNRSLRYIDALRRSLPLIMPVPDVLDRALDLSSRFRSHWDSMLLSACIISGVDTLYTEDMGAPCSYDGLALLNPFV